MYKLARLAFIKIDFSCDYIASNKIHISSANNVYNYFKSQKFKNCNIEVDYSCKTAFVDRLGKNVYTCVGISRGQSLC